MLIVSGRYQNFQNGAVSNRLTNGVGGGGGGGSVLWVTLDLLMCGRGVALFMYSEMKVLDIKHQFNKSLLLYAIHSLFYLQILKKSILFSISIKKPTNQENSSLFMNSIF
jgi:hypothetical protein